MRIRILALFVALAPAVARADWTSFRNGGGSSADCKLPSTWSPEEGIAWQLELPGYGQSTPVVVGDNVYVTAVIGPMKDSCAVVCLSLGDGKELWREEVEASAKAASNYMASRAAPTPVADKRGVYAFFESGDVVAVSTSGEKLWHRNLSDELGQFENNHGLGSSPAQNATHLFINLEHKGPSWLVAVNKNTGQIDWKADRPSGSSWSSPVVNERGGRSLVLVSSAGSLTAYDSATGEKLWAVGDLDGNTVPSPTPLGDHIYVGARLPEFAKEGSVRSNCCIDLSRMEAGQPKVAWRADRAISDYASPVAIGHFVYFINKVGVLTCVDADSGKTLYRHRLSGESWATPIVSGSRLYCFAKNGTAQVIEAGEQFTAVSTNRLWGSEAPPKPEHYVENAGGGHGHGRPNSDSSAKHGGGSNQGEGESGATRRPGGGMMAAMMRGDKDGDGNLSADEVSADFKPMLPRIDTNGDGALDASELKAMAESFAARRASSRSSARDPIVYGAVASSGNILVRTGTRLYCIRDDS
ncbi:MAG: PQQ-binding-like beta-propeller repeat protein [Aureliella sp.]